AAFLRRDRCNAPSFLSRAGIVVHQPWCAGPAGRVDQEQRAGCAVNANALNGFKIDAASELADRNDRRVPPEIRILIDRVTVLPRWGQGGRFHALDVAARIDRAGAHATGSDVDAEEHTRHWRSPSFGTLVIAAQITVAIALQHVWGIDVPAGLCNFLQ